MDEGFIVGWQALLAPAELYESLSFISCDISQELPECLDQITFRAVIWVFTTVDSVALEQFNVHLTSTTDPSLKLFVRSNVQKGLRDDLGDASTNGLALSLGLKHPSPESSLNEQESVLVAHVRTAATTFGYSSSQIDLLAIGHLRQPLEWLFLILVFGHRQTRFQHFQELDLYLSDVVNVDFLTD